MPEKFVYVSKAITFKQLITKNTEILMKRIFTFAAIALLGLAAFSGCGKKSSSPSYSMHASIGGTAFNVTNVYAVITGSILSITGSSGTTSTATPPYFGITIYNYTSPTTYTVDSTATTPTVAGTYAPTSAPADMKAASSGSVVISSASTATISGTFSFKMTDGTVISGGTFTAKRL